jgi:hypothetical protein
VQHREVIRCRSSEYPGSPATGSRSNLPGKSRKPSSLGQSRIAQTFTRRLDGFQGRRRPRANDLAFVLSDSGQDVDGQFVRVRIIDCDELYPGVHEDRDKRDVPGQSIQLGNDELGFLFF